jgi:hypothetical protein
LNRMFNLSVLHIWLKTFGWNLSVCSSCQYFMSGSKLLDGITLYVQLISTSWLGQIKYTGWFNPKLLIQIWSRQDEHTGWFHPKVLNQIRLDGIARYIQLVCSSCLVQNLDGITVYVQLV